MTYSFLCPTPCNHEILVDAENDATAVVKLMKAGALRCRNAAYQCRCEQSLNYLSPMPDEKLRRIVRMCMRVKKEDKNSILATSHG